MKYIKLSIVGLCVVLMASGCSGGKGHPGIGFIPKIKNAIMVNVKDSTSSFTFSIQAEDQDLNMKTLWVTEYHPAGSKTPYNGPNSFPLPKQSSEVMTYYQIGPITLTLSEPVGGYRIDLQIEDASGNKSDVFSL